MQKVYKHRRALDAWARGSEAVSQAWQDSFLSHVEKYDRSCSSQASAEVLMSFIRSGMLRYTDMRDAPERFFAAHRLLASMILGG